MNRISLLVLLFISLSRVACHQNKICREWTKYTLISHSEMRFSNNLLEKCRQLLFFLVVATIVDENRKQKRIQQETEYLIRYLPCITPSQRIQNNTDATNTKKSTNRTEKKRNPVHWSPRVQVLPTDSINWFVFRLFNHLRLVRFSNLFK